MDLIALFQILYCIKIKIQNDRQKENIIMAMFDDVDTETFRMVQCRSRKSKGNVRNTSAFQCNPGRRNEAGRSCIGRWENIFMIILQLQRKEK